MSLPITVSPTSGNTGDGISHSHKIIFATTDVHTASTGNFSRYILPDDNNKHFYIKMFQHQSYNIYLPNPTTVDSGFLVGFTIISDVIPSGVRSIHPEGIASIMGQSASNLDIDIVNVFFRLMLFKQDSLNDWRFV